jgi:hypothetical protein
MNVATPGTGSYRAGWRITGICQFGLAFIGFCFGCAWIFNWCYRIYQAQVGEVVSNSSISWLLKCSVTFFALSFLWTGISCVNLLRRAKRDEETRQKNIPPKLL